MHRPFSHLPGESCLLPGTTYQVTAYPTLLRVTDLTPGGAKPLEIHMQVRPETQRSDPSPIR